jgi:serine/threonine-protein kinase
LARQLWGDLDGIIGKAMETEPARRYGSAEQLGEDLARHLKGQPVVARTHTWGYRAGKFLRRNPRSSTLTAALAVLLVSVSLYSARQARDARREAEKANLVSRFLQNVLAYPYPQLGSPRQDLTYSGVLDSARRHVDLSLGGYPELAAVVRHTLAHGYLGLGQQQAGAKLVREALDLAESTPRPDPALLEHLFSDLGNSMSAEGRYAEADQYFQRALAISPKDSSPENAEQRWTTLQEAALLRFTRGEGPARLDPLYDEALAQVRRFLGPNSLTEAQFLAEHARVRLTFGQMAEARSDLESALRIVRKDPLASIFQLETALILRCVSERMAGNLAQARPFCEEALTANGAPSDRIVLPFVRAEIAKLDVLEGRLDQALKVLQEYLEMCRKNRAHWELGHALTSLGQALALGGRSREAEPLLREALAIRRADLPAGHPWTMDTVGELGAVLLADSRCAEAAPLLEESWTGFHRVLPASHPYLVRADDRLRLLRLRCPSPVGVGEARRN